MLSLAATAGSRRARMADVHPRAGGAGLVIAAVLFLSAPGFPVAAASAQPTWGRPKQTRPQVGTEAEQEQDSEEELGRAKTSPGADWGDNAADPDQKNPSWDAKPGEWYAAKTDAGVRYVWSLPVEAERGKSYDVFISLHPAGENARWIIGSHADVNTEARFRPRDIVVGVDGLTATASSDEHRRFAVGPEPIMAMRDVALQMTRTLPGRRFYLYATADASDFALAFAARFPALADGVLVYRLDRAAEFGFKGTAPMVFMHGARDSRTPLARSLQARAAFEEKGHTGVRLRVLPSFNDYPNPVRASECLDWIVAVQADSASEVLDRVKRILTPKPADQFSYVAPVWFSGAYEALGRITGRETPGKWKPASGISDEALAEATALERAIDAHAAKHVEELKKLVTAPESLAAMDGSPAPAWLWHAREDFRGVPAMEAYITELSYDATLAEHLSAAADLASRWDQTQDPLERVEALPEFLPGACLAPTLPFGMAGAFRIAAKQSEQGLPEDLNELNEAAANVDKTWNEGPRAYRDVWRQWRLPE